MNDKQANKLSEAELLRQQADEARRAVAQAFNRIQDDLKASADVKAWACRYPWPTVGAAAAAGFLTAVAVTPAPRRRRKQKLADMLECLYEDGEIPCPAKRSATRSLLSKGLKLALGAAQSALVAAIAAKFHEASDSEPSDEVSVNGHQPAESQA